MCRPKTPDEQNNEGETPSQYTGANNDILIISHVAAQLAQIGDKLELTYQKTRKKHENLFSIEAVCVMALFVAIRMAL